MGGIGLGAYLVPSLSLFSGFDISKHLIVLDLIKEFLSFTFRNLQKILVISNENNGVWAIIKVSLGTTVPKIFASSESLVSW